MTNNKITEELLTLSYNEINNMPVLNINNELDFLITNKTFLKSFISYYENKNYFNFNLSCNTIKIKCHENNEEVVELYNKQFYLIGLASIHDLNKIFSLILIKLMENIYNE